MTIVTCDRCLRITDRTIDTVGNQLEGHNEQVAYVTYKLMMAIDNVDIDEVHLMCRTAYLHDIGCYKTNDKSELANLEVMNAHAHAAYGYVFLKHFYGNGVNLSAIKYHHLPWNMKPTQGDEVSDYAFLIHLADRIAIATTGGRNVSEYVDEGCGTLFAPEHVALFHKANENNALLYPIKDGSYCIEIRAFLSRFILSPKEVFSMAKMMCYAIDFSSTVTVTHIILVTAIAKKLAQLYFLPDDETENIVQASALHDIGKLIVPVNILEKPGKLTEAEFQIMKYHAATGYDILSTLGLEHLRDIGSLHHEKLDGSGYPFGLKGDQIPFAARLVTVVDILAALLARRSYKEAMDKDTICSILNEMVDQNQIDANIVAKVIENFDEIVDHAKVEADPILFLYESLNDEYEKELEGILTLVK